MRQEEDVGFIRTLAAVLGALMVASVAILVLARAIGEQEVSAADGTVEQRTAPISKVEDPLRPVIVDGADVEQRTASIGKVEDSLRPVIVDGADVEQRTAPIGKVRVAGVAEASTSAAAAGELAGTAPAGEAPIQLAQADKGKAVYDGSCFACHSTGAGGAPKMGDKAAWADRIAQGEATLAEHAIKGFQGKTGMMPPKGGKADLSDDDVKAAISYMVGASQ